MLMSIVPMILSIMWLYASVLPWFEFRESLIRLANNGLVGPCAIVYSMYTIIWVHIGTVFGLY